MCSRLIKKCLILPKMKNVKPRHRNAISWSISNLSTKILPCSFSFQFDDREQLDNQLSELVDTFKVQISKAHLPRLNTDLLLKRTLSPSNQKDKSREPHSAGSKLIGNYSDQKENFENKLSHFATQKQKSEKVLVCKGDLTNEFNFLAEEET